MQYNSTSFTMPFKRIFDKAWLIDEKIDTSTGKIPLQVTDIHYQLDIRDHSWPKIYHPIEKLVYFLARTVGRIQTGNIRIYLGYSFVTLIFLLWMVS